MKNIQTGIRYGEIFRKNGMIYFVAAALLFGMKLFYSRAASDQLVWILAPTARWVELLSRIPFTYEPGMGYVNQELRCLIAPSCAGIHFMLITIALLVFSFVHRIEGVRANLPKLREEGRNRLAKALWVAGSVIFSYVSTVFVNGLRIILAIYLPDFFRELNLLGKILTWERLHTMIGTAVYFAALLAIYRLADGILHKIISASSASGDAFEDLSKRQKEDIGRFITAKKYVLPFFWYFLITIGVPFLNRAYRKEGEVFWRYSFLIMLVCGMVTGVHFLIHFLLRRLTA